MRKIYVVGNDNGYANWMQGTITKNMAEADLVVFTGGEDVHPSFYNEPIHPRSGNNILRDRFEIDEYKKAQKLGKKLIGICRGSQFLCVVSGGRLVQHQHQTGGVHPMLFVDGSTVTVTSSHHQAQFPFNLPKNEYKILGWTTDQSETHQDGNGNEMKPEVECEIVWYPQTNVLGIQSHPEWQNLNSQSIVFFRNLLNDFLQNKNIFSQHETANEEAAA